MLPGRGEVLRDPGAQLLGLDERDLVRVATLVQRVAFEDSPNGVLAAKAAGVFCVAIPNEVTRDLGLAEAGADIVLDSLAELPPEALFRRLSDD